MTADLRDRLDDLLAEVPSYVHADAGTALRVGAGRRVRRRLTAAVAAAAALALVGGVGLAIHRTSDPEPVGDGASRPAASTFPTRIDAPLLRMGDLPQHPGPIAGLLLRNEGWFAVGQHGQVWHVPGSDNPYLASISPDGSRLAYMDTSNGQSELELLDLDKGGAFAPDVGGSGPGHGWLLDGPTFWSPDSSRLFVPVRAAEGGESRVEALLVVPGHASQRIRAPAGRDVVPVGWLSATKLGWLRWTNDQVHADVVTTGPRGGRVLAAQPARGRVPLNLFVNASLVPSERRAHMMSVTTSDRQLLISNPGHRVSAVVASRRVAATRLLSCPTSWTDSYPVFPADGPGSHLLWDGPSSYRVQLDPALQPVACSVWSYDALRGHADGGMGEWLFGERTNWLSWHWRQVGLASLVVLAALTVGGILLRRRRRVTYDVGRA